jgi:small subunit ribosomal protein S2
MEETPISNELVTELAENGIIYGHKKTKTHPKMKPFIGANRNEIELFKPESIMESLKKTTNFLTNAKKENKLILVVATQPAAAEIAHVFAESFEYPYVTNRWLGGTLTNFKVIRGRVKHYLDLQTKQEKGELKRYTKKEQHEFSKELNKLQEKFHGLVRMDRTPDILFVIDGNQKSHRTAINEAHRMKIPIAGIIDSDDNPDDFAEPIIANDHAKRSITWLIEKITEGMKKVTAQKKDKDKKDTATEKNES